MRHAPRLIAITDTGVCGETEMLQRAEQLCYSCRPGSVVIQLRDRELGIRDRLRLGQRLRGITAAHSQSLSINDRADLALVLGAQGLHLGESSAPAVQVRGHFKDRFWVTRASHDVEACQGLGADAVLLSPVCSPRKGAESHGMDALARACRLAGVPVFALGGVTAGNAAACIEAGAAGVAAIGAWLSSKALQPLIEALGIARPF